MTLMRGKDLLDLGYRRPLPVALHRKYPSLEVGGTVRGFSGWQHTENWDGKSPGLGLALEGLLMVDIDIDAERGSAEYDMIDQLLWTVERKVGELGPIRQRKGSTRCAMLLRAPHFTEGRSARVTTPKWAQGRVELKAGSREFMFGWGIHPSGERLSWWHPNRDEASDFSHNPSAFEPFNALPEWTGGDDELQALAADFRRRLIALGEPIGPARDVFGVARTFDLRWDMVFTTQDGRQARLDELYVGENTDEWVNLTPWREDSDSLAGHIMESSVFPGTPVVYDFVTHVEHFMDPEGELDTFEDLDISVLDVEPLEETARAVEADLALLDRERRLLFVREEGKWGYIDDPTGSLMAKEAAFYEYGTKERKEAIQRVTNVVQKQVWDPRLPPLSIVHNKERQWHEHNTFSMPQHLETGGETSTFNWFMSRFVPDDWDRELLTLWLAHKTQNPWWRSFATVLVGPQGSGKGSFWSLITALFGSYNVSSLSNIAGVYHSQYQDALYKKLWVLIDEVSGEEAGSEYAGKRRSADRLKGFVEPQPSVKQLNIKGKRYVDSVVCASVGISTNHVDAIPLDPDDRRFFVVSTGGKLSPQETRRFHEWLRRPQNVGALWRLLKSMDLSGFNHLEAPATQAKERMREANTSQVDETMNELRAFVEAKGGVISRQLALSFAFSNGITAREERAFMSMFRRETTQRVVKVEGKAVRLRAFNPMLLERPTKEIVDSYLRLTTDIDVA